MKKRTIWSATLGLAAFFAIITFAGKTYASGWSQENGNWYYRNKNDEYIKNDWVQDEGKEEVYYLDGEGKMLANKLLELDGKFYYLRSSGARLVNGWRFVKWEDQGQIDPENWLALQLVQQAQGEASNVGEILPEDETLSTYGSWYYFGANGQAYTSKNGEAKVYTIGDKKYIFDERGRLLTGWINEAGQHVDQEDWYDGTYYAPAEVGSDGSILTNAWLYTDVEVEDSEDDDSQNYHFYFAANGKKCVDEERKIDGKQVRFDEQGLAYQKWHQDEDGEWKYYGEGEETWLHTGWFKAVPDENFHDSDSTYWFYADSKGVRAVSCFKTISGNVHAFNQYGELITGLKAIKTNPDDRKEIVSNRSVSSISDVPTGIELTDENLYYCSGDKGALKYGEQTISLDGSDYTFEFSKSSQWKGAGYTGIKDNAIYDHGLRLQAEEGEKLEVVEWYQERGDEYEEAQYLVNEKGVIQKNKRNIKNADGYFFCTDAKGIVLHGPMDGKCDGEGHR